MPTYRTDFQLEYPVKDMNAAQAYLDDPQLGRYLHSFLEDNGMPDTAQKIISIAWSLLDVDSGYITLETNDYLNDNESKEISDWICGQNSDGLGEGFEQQPFASYDLNEENESDDDYYEEWVMASFDWQYNNYPLILQ